MTIQSFSDKTTEQFFLTGKAGIKLGWNGIKDAVMRKLDLLHYAHTLSDLRAPPGNRLEGLKGGLSGFHSIRVNNQWRIIFRWTQFGPEEVRIVDYH